MAHHTETTEHLTHNQLKFKEHTERAGHFIKIDLFRSAREEFKEALKYKTGDALCIQRIDEMNSNIARDRKAVLIIAPLVILLILAVALLV
ncbi:MAG: hypothetical protein NT004_18145 [Bacteroidetes bacterium]|nr:hypothetical protein [Bacteroidota bacterium]